jgi:methyl-accepting chemotaxis protein
MDGSLEAIEAVRSAREGAGRSRRWRFAAWLGRINTRAAMISMLLLAVIGLLAGTAVTTLKRQALIIDELGIRSRQADSPIATLASGVEAYGTTLAGVVAGSVQPGAIAARMVAQAAHLSAAFQAVEQAVAPDVDPAAIDLARDSLARIPGFADRVQQTLAGRRRGETAPLHDEWRDIHTGFDRLVNAAREHARSRADAAVETAHRVADNARLLTFAGVALGVAVTILVWVMVVATIARPVTVLAQSMVRVARGDVAAPVPHIDREDQLGTMARALLAIRDSLNITRSRADSALEGARLTFDTARLASDATTDSAAALATQVEALSHHTDAVRAAADTMLRLARESEEARDRAGDAKLLLDDSMERIRGLDEALSGGDDDRERVERVTMAIVRMATQANMLAANAAREASRTDADGAGMTAVAMEARALAGRSEALAIEIAETVDGLGRKARDAARTARGIVDTADRMETLVAETARLAGSVAVDMAQQNEALHTLCSRFMTLRQVAQANASAAEQTRVGVVALSSHAAETRVAVEAIAVASRLGRNA